MDISNGIESRVPLLAIPDHLVFAVEEWIAEQIRRACDSADSPEAQAAVIRAVHVRDGFVAGSLTPAQVAELAEGAADWLHPQWPTDPKSAAEVQRLAALTRELLELRDHALAIAADTTNIARVVTVDPGLREVLRSQTLLVLEFNHEPFEDLRDLAPAELLTSAAIFRDAITVLDTIGWLPSKQTATVELSVSAGHLAQLERLRADLTQSIVEGLDSREELTEPEDIARFDEAVAADRRTVDGLRQLLRAGPLEP
jgi:predicted component of type VI protein secretion system